MSNYESITVTEQGGPEVLHVSTENVMPTPDAGKLVVQVAAAGINFIEIYQRSGIYTMSLPFVPGSEFSGVVTAIGSDVKNFAVGDRVMTSGGSGAYAEYATVSESQAIRIPENIDLEAAAAIPLQGITAHYLARSVYEISGDDTVLIHAGAGGVGQLLTQIAVALGATVITTASTDEKRQISLSRGAKHSIPYEGFADKVRELTDGEGVNVVYDGVGKNTYLDSIKALRIRGHISIFGAASGPVPSLDIQLLNKAGSVSLSRPSLAHFTRDREELQWRADELFTWMSAGKLEFAIGGRYPLAQAAQAHQDLAGRLTTGKLLLVPSSAR